jgi:polysaccharide biosynthesis protein PelA
MALPHSWPMGRRLKQSIAALLCLAGCSYTFRPTTGDINHWAAYYDTALPARAFKHYDLVVFDRRAYPNFDYLKGRTKVLAYVSMGEIYADVPEKILLDKDKSILFHNATWNSYAVDVTSAMWHRMVLANVKDAAEKGFDGVMLDTIDSPLYWAKNQGPERSERMREGAVSLIRAIRAAHPDMLLMVNRGFEILPLVAKNINFVLAESILTHKDETSGQFAFFSSQATGDVVQQLHQLLAREPQLQVLTIDYWNMDDVNGLERIYATQRAHGFVPYVTTPDLSGHTPEPRRNGKKR